jgi:hypothetical protein
MNKLILPRPLVAMLVAGGALLDSAATPATAALPPAAMKHWTADNGNGTYSNPLFYGEFEDPDVIRVGEDYYLAGTTMHMMPAVELLHSKDLVNWELAGYCTNRLDLGPAYRLEGGNIYGQGIWAPCIRHHNGIFYIFANVNRAAHGQPFAAIRLPALHARRKLGRAGLALEIQREVVPRISTAGGCKHEAAVRFWKAPLRPAIAVSAFAPRRATGKRCYQMQTSAGCACRAASACCRCAGGDCPQCGR